MGKRKLLFRIICIILALTMAFSLLVSILASLTGNASYTDKLDELKTEQTALEQQQQEMDARIEELKKKNISALNMKVVLDEQISLTQQQIDNIDNQISVYNAMIGTWENKIADLQGDADDQLSSYKLRLRAMEENGTVMYYSVLFAATSISDFMNRLDFIMEIREYDNNLYGNLVEYQRVINEAESEMGIIQTEIDSLSSQRIILEAQLEVEVENAVAVISNVENNIAEYRQEFAEITEAETSIQEYTLNVIQALQRQESAIANIGTGDFIWPCLNNRNVVQQYGTRLNSAYYIYRYHSGIDIAAEYGASVLAADGGTIVTATYNAAYGNYIIINHGTGAITVYANLSKITVSSGDTVVQGQVIGKAGASGSASRCILHFEVSISGSRVNPLDYFSNYQIVG